MRYWKSQQDIRDHSAKLTRYVMTDEFRETELKKMGFVREIGRLGM
jgi:hypothetical protein